MNDLIILAVHVIATVMKLVRPGGVRAVLAESVLATSIVDSEPVAAARPESPSSGSANRRILFALD